MTEAAELAEIESERRRHLANWLIESTPHMPRMAQYRGIQHKVNDKLFNTSIFNDSFLLSRKSNAESSDYLNVYSKPVVSKNAEKSLPPQNTNFPFSKSNTPSRTSQPICETFEPSLRRYMTQDTGANTFSVAEFEMARQTRKKENKQEKINLRPKSKVLNSGCDSNTGGSKRSNNEADSEPLSTNVFFERFRLPQLARISEPLQERQSQDKIRKQSSLKNFLQHFPVQTEFFKKSASACNEVNNNTELFLLHRLCKNYKVYHAATGKHARKKLVRIPEGFGGYFSIVRNGESTAITYTTITQLIRDKVFKFISSNKLEGYTESCSKEHYSKKSHYSKICIKSGEVLNLLAVFEDGAEECKLNRLQKENAIINGREKEKGRYVQLVSENHQIIYVPISAKGKFFEIDALKECGHRTKNINPDFVYKLNSIINDSTIFPLSLRLMVNTIGPASIVNLDYITILRMSTEDFVIALKHSGAEVHKNAHLEKINLVSDMKFDKAALPGFDNEHLQNLQRFCDSYCDSFLSTVELERLTKIGASTSVESLVEIRKGKFKSKVFAKYLNTDKHSPAHEIEDSIIFLSKSELKEKYLTPKKHDHEVLARETRPSKWDKNSPSSVLNKNSSEASLDSHSSQFGHNIAFCKFFSMQNLVHNRTSSNNVNDPSLSSRNNNESVQLQQKSFITEKLFNEFYHSTKQQSKSSSCLLNQLLFKAKKVSIKTTNVHLGGNPAEEKDMSALMHLTLPPPPKELAVEELPYYHVHDEIKAEDIYAEICGADFS